ncbi:MAG: ATPase, T2SS/T4P/T4SS family, partial [Nanoarchaeota archaeon]
RRHRDKPWTLPLFINNKMIDPLGAGLMSFLIDGARTLLVAGTRSSGKTSLLGSFLVEIMRKYRVIVIEDTIEMPSAALRKLGYNIQNMKVRSALTTGGTEVAADEGIRTSLRLGDSSLIVGEVRSNEARALYEAMRIGALANVVAGTIHGDSPYGVFDRVVNDLGVPRTSFKATDIIVIANPVKSADGLHNFRRVRSITEVRKHWQEDPLREGGFVDLMKYNAKKDLLEPTDELINGESETLKTIAGNVRELVGNWDAIWENIQLRANIKKAIVDYANKTKMLDLLEAEFVIASNDEFHRILDAIKEETGYLDTKRIYFEWDNWIKREIKKRRFG